MENKTLVLRAPVSGTLLRIEVPAGESVSAGTTIAIVESMKMEIPVEAERDGVIAQWHANEGDTVQEDAPLADIGPR